MSRKTIEYTSETRPKITAEIEVTETFASSCSNLGLYHEEKGTQYYPPNFSIAEATDLNFVEVRDFANGLLNFVDTTIEKFAAATGDRSVEDQIPEVCFKDFGEDRWAQRRIVSAANRFPEANNLVLVSARHMDNGIVNQILTLRNLGLNLGSSQGENQGFIDQFGDYWTRAEAWVIALHAGQIRHPEHGGTCNKLYSEHLY